MKELLRNNFYLPLTLPSPHSGRGKPHTYLNQPSLGGRGKSSASGIAFTPSLTLPYQGGGNKNSYLYLLPHPSQPYEGEDLEEVYSSMGVLHFTHPTQKRLQHIYSIGFYGFKRLRDKNSSSKCYRRFNLLESWCSTVVSCILDQLHSVCRADK